MIKPIVLDIETSISNGPHGPDFRDQSNDIYTFIYGCKPTEIHVEHELHGFSRTPPPGMLDMLQSATHIIGHNLSFDLSYIWGCEELKQFILRGGVLWDTQVAEYILTAQQHQYASLGELQSKYLNQKLKIDRISRLYAKGVGADHITKASKRCPRLFKLYEEYCCLDGSTTLQIFKEQWLKAKQSGMFNIIQLYQDYLLALINITNTGICIDTHACEETLKDFNLKHIDYLQQAQNLIKKVWNNPRLPEFNINSPDHKSAVLFGGEIKNIVRTRVGKYKNGNDKYANVEHKIWVDGFQLPKTLTRTTKKKGVFVTNDAVMQNIASKTKNAAVREYCALQKEAMMYKKAAKTYVEAFINLSVNGKLYPNFNNTAVVTGRLSSSRPNLQNVSKRNKFGKVLHSLFIAPPGWKAVQIDFSQLEIWVSAFLSMDTQLIEDLQTGLDMHCMRVANMEGCDYDYAYRMCKELQDAEWVKKRTAAKTFSYQRAYGCGLAKLVEFTGLDRETLTRLIDSEELRYPKASELWKEVEKSIKTTTTFSLEKNKPATLKNDRNTCGALNLMQIFDNTGTVYYNKERKEKIGYWKSPTGKKYHFAYTANKTKFGVRESVSPTVMKNYPMQGCLHGDTMIFSKEYGMKTIKELVLKPVTVWTDGGYSRANCVYSGKKRLVEIEMMDGNVIKCSPEHKFKYVNPSTLYEGWITAKDIINKKAEGKRVAIKLGGEVEFTNINENTKFPEEIIVNKPHNYKNLSVNNILDQEDLGFFLGRLASDGTIRKNKSIRFIVAEHEKEYILPRLENICKQIGKYRLSVKTRQNRSQKLYYIDFDSCSLARQLKEVKYKVPSQCWNSSTIMSGYLCGMFDGDGTVDRGGNISLCFGGGTYKYKWALEIQLALRLFGIRSRVRHYNYRTDVNIMQADNVQFADYIGFENNKKANKINISGTVRKRHNISYVRTATDVGEFVDMYDIVNSENKTFCANGLVTHNTAADIQAATTAELLKTLIENPDKIQMINEVHDSKWFYVKEEFLSEIIPTIRDRIENVSEIFMRRFNLDVPFKFPVDVEVGDNFAYMSTITGESNEKNSQS